MRLSILCVTSARPAVLPCIDAHYDLLNSCRNAEFVLAADGDEARRTLARYERDRVTVAQVRSAGFIESALEEALGHCQGEYVLRLDDDERPSFPLAWWLGGERYRVSDHWKFPRAYMWGDDAHFLDAAPFWPDWQTRLSVRAKAGGRTMVHAGSPFGGGTEAPVAIEHYKFLVQSLAEREALVAHYDSIQPGAGTRFRSFYIPEEAPSLSVAPWDGGVARLVDAAYDNALAHGFPMAQYRDEITGAARWLLGQAPLRRVLEIGTHQGGTAAFWCELADHVISVDLPDGPFGGLDKGAAEVRNARLLRTYANYARFTGILGDSRASSTLHLVEHALDGEKLDLLFIDGDHRYEGVKGDLALYRRFVRPGGVVLFHDIVDTPFIREQGAEVYKLWPELRGDKREFRVAGGDFGGLGALTL